MWTWTELVTHNARAQLFRVCIESVQSFSFGMARGCLAMESCTVAQLKRTTKFNILN